MRKAAFGIVVALLLTGVAWADCTTKEETLTCPTFRCDDGSHLAGVNECARCDSASDICYLKACSDSAQTCPPPSSWFSGNTVQCMLWDEAKWSATSFEEYYNVVALAQNATCIPNDPKSRCSFDDDLVCTCQNGPCTCEPGIGYGGACDATSTCLQGYVCNSGACMKINSIEAGLAVTDALVCVSGEVKSDGTELRCTNPARTLGMIPKQCTSCQDCYSVDGKSFSECTCGLNGKAYCALLDGDDPWLEYKNLAPNQRFEGIIYWQFVIENYPFLTEGPDCIDSVWRDYSEYEKGAPNYSASARLLLAGLLLIGLTA